MFGLFSIYCLFLLTLVAGQCPSPSEPWGEYSCRLFGNVTLSSEHESEHSESFSLVVWWTNSWFVSENRLEQSECLAKTVRSFLDVTLQQQKDNCTDRSPWVSQRKGERYVFFNFTRDLGSTDPFLHVISVEDPSNQTVPTCLGETFGRGVALDYYYGDDDYGGINDNDALWIKVASQGLWETIHRECIVAYENKKWSQRVVLGICIGVILPLLLLILIGLYACHVVRVRQREQERENMYYVM